MDEEQSDGTESQDSMCEIDGNSQGVVLNASQTVFYFLRFQ